LSDVKEVIITHNHWGPCGWADDATSRDDEEEPGGALRVACKPGSFL
jgi:hypothetical protein